MKYRGGYKYQLAEDEVFQTSIRPVRNIFTPRIELMTDGVLTVKEGYAFDGASGPVLDRKTNIRPSCGHDALYQLMRMGRVRHYWWTFADADYGRWLIEDGAWPITAKVDLFGLRLGRGFAALPVNRKEIQEAP